MFEQLLKVRYLAVVVVILAVLHAVTFMYIGAAAAVKTYWHVFSGRPGEAPPGLELLHAIDSLLVALVMIILAVGVAKLFLLSNQEGRDLHLPRWLDVETFADLKILLWQTILLALVIIGLSSLIAGSGGLSWNALVIPGAILLLSLSLYLMKQTERA